MTDSTPSDDAIVSPTGSRIVGTEEKLTACALARFDWDGDRAIYDHVGETECDWDSQRTATSPNGETLVRDTDGTTWPITQCMPRSHWQTRRGQLDTYVFTFRREYTPEQYLTCCTENDLEPTPDGWHDWVLADIAEDVCALPDDGLMNYVQRVPTATDSTASSSNA
jgi:hypothetical protein